MQNLFNEDAEKLVLGVLLSDNDSIDSVADILKSEHFYIPIHQKIYDAIRSRVVNRQNASAMSLSPFFSDPSELPPDYLQSLAGSCATSIGVRDTAEIIIDFFKRRKILFACETAVKEIIPGASSYELSSDAISESLQDTLYRISESAGALNGFAPVEDAIDEFLQATESAYKSEKKIIGVPTGIINLDENLGGLHPSDLVILAGRPGMGKTALATNFAVNAVKDGYSVGFFSLEMSKSQLWGRIVAAECKVPAEDMRRGMISSAQMASIVETSGNMKKLRMYVNDTPAQSVSAVRAQAKKLKRQRGLDLIVIDYLQLMSGDKRSENRVNEVSEITRGLKCLAKELNVPVLALSQLSRQTETRVNKRPLLGDLRESGSIEQDADVVMFVFREEYYLQGNKPSIGAEETDERYRRRVSEWEDKISASRGTAEIILAKNRHGPMADIQTGFDGKFTSFYNLQQQIYGV
jgi:replicative DNA helicase